jgi:hypothetical protein
MSGNGALVFSSGIPAGQILCLTGPAPSAGYNATGGVSVLAYNESDGQFLQLPYAGTMGHMQGYVFSSQNNSAQTRVEISGRMENGPFVRTNMLLTDSLPENARGYFLTGNPYPASIAWDLDNGVQTSGISRAVYIWDPLANGGKGTFRVILDSLSLNGTSRVIAPGQAFFLKASQAGAPGSLTLNRACRITPGNPPSEVAQSTKVLRLALTAQGLSDESLIRFTGQATSGFDQQVDATKLFSLNPDVPQIYSKADSLTETKYAVNSLPEAIGGQAIPIGIRGPYAGIYTITAAFDTSLAGGKDIFLHDLREDSLHDLRSAPNYIFQHTLADSGYRFLLRLIEQQIHGKICYANTVQTPMRNITITAASVVTHDSSAALTASDGTFSLHRLPAGPVSLTYQTPVPWGGSNALDALMVMQHFVNIYPLYGIHLKAADVTADGFVNTQDAFEIQRRFAWLTQSFTSGDWCYNPRSFTSSETMNPFLGINACCFGDVNGSYTPLSKASPGLSYEPEGTIDVSNQAEFILPLICSQSMLISAVSLSIELKGLGLQPADIRFGSDNGSLVYNLLGSRLLLSWFSLVPWDVKPGDTLLFLRVMATAGMQGTLTLLEAGENIMHGPEGETYSEVKLKYPMISEQARSGIACQVHPNPVSDEALIRFDIPESGLVDLSIYNTLSEKVMVIALAGLPSGQHEIRKDLSSLGAGVYLLNLKLLGAKGVQTYTTRVLINN